MPRLEPAGLLSLEEYAGQRNEFRARVIDHKKHRAVPLGENVTLLFEDEMTIRYQVQEMLRAERIFEEAGIRDELEAYNPLIPDGCNFKATMMIEYPDEDERRVWLSRLVGVERRVWIRVAGCARVWAIADEDLERETAEKTSSVHFLRLELEAEMARMLKSGAGLSAGIDHPNYQASIDLPPGTRDSLVQDLA